VFVSLIPLWICVVFFVLCLKCQRPKNFPPGPPPLPILGNLLNFSLDNPMRDLERLRKCYGNVYSLFIGPKPAVVIDGVQAMKEAMMSKAADFAGRPEYLPKHHMPISMPVVGMVLADYGLSWKEHRRFALMTLRNFGLGKQSMGGNTVCTCSNIICQVLFGTLYGYNDEFIKVVVQCFKENSKIANGPWAMLRNIQHFATESSSEIQFKSLIRCQQEIDHMLEMKTQITYDDRHNMPYMQTVIHEIQRIANTAPLSVFHSTTKDTELMGYFLPKKQLKGTLVIQNLNSVLNEEGQWKFPHEFKPENFLNDQGEFVKPKAFVPFSAGSRMCLGETHTAGYLQKL
uniref:Uncharacterized protein n=1 Tax=Lates calcarifer TaxID=8187 RepID=A0A4W6G7I0_LATCA